MPSGVRRRGRFERPEVRRSLALARDVWCGGEDRIFARARRRFMSPLAVLQVRRVRRQRATGETGGTKEMLEAG